MGYRQVLCPSCGQAAETTYDRRLAVEVFAIHTYRDGSGRLCDAVGRAVLEGAP